MELDVGEKYGSQTHRPLEAGTITVMSVINIFRTDSIQSHIPHPKLPAFLKYLPSLNLPELHSIWDCLSSVLLSIGQHIRQLSNLRQSGFISFLR
jgi:hypothetical protein